MSEDSIRDCKNAEIFQNHLPNALRQLNGHELIECINPEVRKCRLYRWTENAMN